MTQLEKLQLEYTTHKLKYNSSNEFSRDRHYNNMQKAWENLRKYKLKNCPELLQQLKSSYKSIPFIPMSDWAERFEEYGD